MKCQTNEGKKNDTLKRKYTVNVCSDIKIEN